MTDDKDHIIKELQKKIRKLETTLEIVTNYSGKTENRMRKQFEVISETIPVPMIIARENNEIIFANLSAQKIFSYTPDDLIKHGVSWFYNNPDARRLFLETLSNKGEVNGFRVELKKLDGSLFPASIFSREINFDGQDCILTVIHDLTQVMALEKQLRQTQKMEAIGTLTSGIAHDFNNILMAIFGYTQLAENFLDAEKDNKIKRYLDNILKAASRAKDMIMQMMTFCTQSEKEKKTFRISAIVAEVVKLMGNLTPSNIHIQSNISAKNMMIMGDPTQIHQVVTNLITNAVHALSGKGGKIEVIMKKVNIAGVQTGEIPIPEAKPGSYARITIRDNGPGIVKDVIDNIFDPFFTTKPVGQGSGMGLAVVHGIIQGHEGAVSVESEPGKGTAFHCYFPVIKDSDETTKPDIESESVGKGDENILLVDDDTLVLDACGEMLEALGYRVALCTGSKQAMKIFETRPQDFDLVITDNIMPEMSGTELSRKILKIRPDIPIILVTGTQHEKEYELNKPGIRAFIQKPFDLQKMQSVIREVLDFGKII
ncbi:ATP-binding protein [Desulfococcaceae bacterium HSG9]|nr:ATP-binding protein [Desulfococcaceae bacterium HSG9]